MSAWLWPDHLIGKRESRRLREEHNKVVNAAVALRDALVGILPERATSIHGVTRDCPIAMLRGGPCPGHPIEEPAPVITARMAVAHADGLFGAECWTCLEPGWNSPARQYPKELRDQEANDHRLAGHDVRDTRDIPR